MSEVSYIFGVIMFVMWFCMWADVNEIKWQLKEK